MAKAEPAPGDGAVPELGTGSSQQLSLSIHSCSARHETTLGSDAGFSLVSKHLLFQGLGEIPALLFWCLCHATRPFFCIYLFPSNYWGHTVLLARD